LKATVILSRHTDLKQAMSWIAKRKPHKKGENSYEVELKNENEQPPFFCFYARGEVKKANAKPNH